MEYRCVATTLEGFVQQIATNYLRHGYYFYVMGCVPAGKDPRDVDEKLTRKYGIGISSSERYRRKRAGWASIQYLRFERTWILLATHGRHPFFDAEERNIKDARRIPIKIGGYSISHAGGHCQVRIRREEIVRLRARLLELATHRSALAMGSEFGRIPFEPYHRVRRQLLRILRAVNRERKVAGFSRIPYGVIRYKRRIVRVFEPAEVEDAERVTEVAA